jgi:hypothetical protein
VTPGELLCDFRHLEKIICGVSAVSGIDILRSGHALRAELDPIAILIIGEIDLNRAKLLSDLL